MYSSKSNFIKSFSIYLVTVFCLCIFSTVAFVNNANAATLTVPSGYATIQSAIDASINGDTVLVSNGTYTESINFNGKAITVKSVNGAGSTTINGNSAGSVVTFVTGETSGSTLDGFTITNGSAGWGGGIYCYSSSPTITNCKITGNSATYDGGGIYCGYSSSPAITNCTITGNSASSNGGGILSEGSSTPTIINCTITYNTTVYGDGGGIACGGVAAITSCTIRGNTAVEYGGGIYCSGTTSLPTITNCTISGNSAVSGGGIHCSYASSPAITNCTITGNSASSNGGGIYCQISYPTITNSILWGDTASSGNEIYLGGGSITVTYSDIKGGWTGTGNRRINPRFVGNGNYHLISNSPCVDVGTATGAPADDIDGDSRPQGNGYDMGSDEVVP